MVKLNKFFSNIIDTIVFNEVPEISSVSNSLFDFYKEVIFTGNWFYLNFNKNKLLNFHFNKKKLVLNWWISCVISDVIMWFNLFVEPTWYISTLEWYLEIWDTLSLDHINLIFEWKFNVENSEDILKKQNLV